MRFAVSVAALMLVAGSAQAQTVTYDYDKNADFSAVKTYTWIPGTSVADQFNDRRIIAAVDSQLALKGLTRVAKDAKPDVYVAYHANFGKDVQVTGFSTGWAGYRWGASRSGTARATEITTGRLVIDIIDSQASTIIWRGSVTKDLDPNASPEKKEKNLNKAVEKLFKKYPRG